MKKEIKGVYYIKDVNERFGNNLFINISDTVYYNIYDYEGYWSSDFKHASRRLRLEFHTISTISKLLNELKLELDKNIKLNIVFDYRYSEFGVEYCLDLSGKLSIKYNHDYINDIEKFSIVINNSLIKSEKNFEKVYLNCVYSNDNNIEIDLCDDYITLKINDFEELDL